jgi:predicted transcriptional regulator
MQREGDQSRIILDILESVDRDGARPQRSRASEVGIALGLVNAYLKFCIRKGYLKARKIPARGYQYMLTPKGFAEKSRLALSRLSDSLVFVHASRGEYAALFAQARDRGWTRIVIVSTSPLAEICTICALERELRIVALVDADCQESRKLGVPVFPSIEQVNEVYDGAVIADLHNPGPARDWAVAALGESRVMIPGFLNTPTRKPEAAQ